MEPIEKTSASRPEGPRRNGDGNRSIGFRAENHAPASETASRSNAHRGTYCVARIGIATAKDAAAGNPRAKKALELLNAGKIAEAVPLFQAEAAEKEATSRVSAKEAAAAYRNLGAIAGLRDPKRALEAYEKALLLH
jgi:hypothetical protein